MTHDYAKGQFQSYRAITKIHLGAISDNLSEGEEIEYDGHVLKRGNDEHSLHSLRAAIKVGWLVPVAAPPTKYVPKPAGVTVHRANGMDDSEINLSTVFETDVNVGTLDEVRPDAAPRTHRAIAAGQENTGEGRIVGKVKISAKMETVQIGKDDRKVVASLDNRERVATAVATGDVQEARGGEELVDLLPDAATAGIPKPGPSGEGSGDQSEDRARAFTATGSSTIGGAEEGKVIGTVGTPQAPDGLGFIQQFIPGFEWDMEVQWAKRVKIACEKYGGIPAVLDYIKSIETSAVRKHIDKRLSDSQR